MTARRHPSLVAAIRRQLSILDIQFLAAFDGVPGSEAHAFAIARVDIGNHL